jgi:hypothetical protein
MKRLLVLGWPILATSLVGQVEPAPTVAQCQADQRLWLSQLEAQPPDSKLPDFNTLTHWETEMTQCQMVDSASQAKLLQHTGREQ